MYPDDTDSLYTTERIFARLLDHTDRANHHQLVHPHNDVAILKERFEEMQGKLDALRRVAELEDLVETIYAGVHPFNPERELEIYMDDGRVFHYAVDDAQKAREHMSAIIMEGYRSVVSGQPEWYPPYRIKKVKYTGEDYDTKYIDGVVGT